MYLKELTLKGFKSFASPTTLRFEPGITAVVGPNGSGKSNIVDALTWVMGEQGAKNLRGTSMEDVIFAGTSSRPPLGRAQVSLTIDNTDHALDIDYTEVTISRTIFRNGGSEYAINGTSCRLLDIQELLSDTGLGQQMHVIVGQGRLDAILKADPSGHRAFIEEAAGILKHRKRKERALRKLANTEANLSRLDDLLGEIRRQLGPLGRQARVSRRADGIQVTLRDARSRILADDAHQSASERERVRTELTEVRTQLGTTRQQLAHLKVRIEQVESMTSATSPAIAQANQQWHELSRIHERLQSLASVADERARSLDERIVTNLGEDPALLTSRANELDAQHTQQQQVAQEARLAFDKATEYRADHEKRLASVRQTLTELRRTAQQRETRIANLREMIAREESAVQLAATRSNDFTVQRDELVHRHDAAVRQRDELERTMHDDEADDATSALDEARRTLSAAQDALNEVQDQQRELNAKIISLTAKADALRDTLDSRNATGALERDSGVDVLARLSDCIHIEDGWEEAIAHALGAFSGALVVAQRSNMLHALERAREDKLGRAVVLTPSTDDQYDIADDSGSVRCAASLVTANSAASDQTLADGVVRAVRSLLADVAVAETLEQADAIISTCAADDQPDQHKDGRVVPSRFRVVVTQAGEIITAVGGAGGSSSSHSDLALVARRDKALARVNELRQQLAALDTKVEQARAQRDRARLAVDHAATARAEARLAAKQQQQMLNTTHDRIADLERQIRAFNNKIAASDESRDDHQLKVDDLNRALAAAQAGDGPEDDADELTAHEHELEQALTSAREQEMTAKIAWNDANRKSDSLERQVGLLRDQAQEAATRRARLTAENDKRREQAAHIRQVAAHARAVAELVNQSITDVAAHRDELQQTASSHDEELKTLRAQRDELEPVVNDLDKREHTLDVTRERLATEYGQTSQKIADELGVSVDELIREFGPDQPVPVLDDNGLPVPIEGDVDTDVADGSAIETGDDSHEPQYRTVPYVRSEQIVRYEKAKRDLSALGKVNPLAAEEYDALQTRNQYLHDQRDDVAHSRDDLMQLVHDLDATMVDVFRRAFDDTATAFEQVFATLFPGGTGRLRLENPDDLLTTGVIVEASPAGKRVKQLSLLSGGERSLTALALLFAIFTARPSPFYVMDEVEAALDDVNLTRLINALRQLREHAQLIIITHQQRTMSIADALYGVTMRADGVTAVVSQRLVNRS
ncbi:chromosome segregation protein SMC [Bifidobacterium hapali]|uniref:Chromosome partition protein Smc n=1 Tax=Bifidobacterium hapali TaxID=1630172 RepID=A0A261G4R7_9BIFI|nr:chromosome segregation protein SMC [Bifidobacterium hapali]OZG66398.1 chromosome segregation protein SMC [Bifidobacterium hapali]